MPKSTQVARTRVCRGSAAILLGLLVLIPTAMAEFSLYQGPSGPVKGWELIADQNHTTGFNAFGNCRNDGDKACYATPKKKILNPLHPENANVDAVWDLFELASKTTVRGQTGGVEGQNVTWANDNKNITIYPEGKISMAVNGMSEYDGKYLPDWNDRKWVHFAVSQTIAAPGPHARPSGSLADMSKLQFRAEARLTYHQANHKPGYDRNRHAVAYGLSFTIQNLTKDHPGFGQYIWLQIPFYDDREELPGGGSGMDEGTGSLMVPVPFADFGVESLQKGKWVRMEKDILPYARKGIELAASKGHLKSGNLADYHIGGMVVGYELWGLDITTVEMRGVSLKVDTSNLYPSTGLYADLNSISKDAPVGKPGSQGEGSASQGGEVGGVSAPEPKPEPEPATTPFVQMYNPDTGKHVWAPEASDGMKASDNQGYIKTNTLGKLNVSNDEPGGVPLTLFLRESSTDYFLLPNASDADEKAMEGMGYQIKGSIGYAFKEGGKGRKPIYSLYSAAENRHFYTDDVPGYYTKLKEQGWAQEGIRFWVKE